MTTIAALNREALVGERQGDLAAEARAMVNGEQSMLANPLHVTALVMELEKVEERAKGAERDVIIALGNHNAAKADIESLQGDLRTLRLQYDEAIEELRTARELHKHISDFISDVDRCSMIVADYLGPRVAREPLPKGD